MVTPLKTGKLTTILHDQQLIQQNFWGQLYLAYDIWKIKNNLENWIFYQTLHSRNPYLFSWILYSCFKNIERLKAALLKQKVFKQPPDEVSS